MSPFSDNHINPELSVSAVNPGASTPIAVLLKADIVAKRSIDCLTRELAGLDQQRPSTANMSSGPALSAEDRLLLGQMENSIRNILDLNFSRIDRELAEVKELQTLHTTRFTSIECKMEAGFQEVKAALGGLKGEVGTIRGELGSIRAEIAKLRAVVLERMPKS